MTVRADAGDEQQRTLQTEIRDLSPHLRNTEFVRHRALALAIGAPVVDQGQRGDINAPCITISFLEPALFRIRIRARISATVIVLLNWASGATLLLAFLQMALDLGTLATMLAVQHVGVCLMVRPSVRAYTDHLAHAPRRGTKTL